MKPMHRLIALLLATAVAAVLIASNPGTAAETAAATSAASPASQAPPQSVAAPQGKIDPRVEQLLNRSCDALAASRAFTFHAEITFDQVLPSNVKLQFAAAADYAVQRPDQFAVDYHSDLGAKQIWYSGDQITIFDPPHMVYATAEVPASIDGMMERLGEGYNLTIPMADLALSHPCQMFRERMIYAAYVGVNDVSGEDCDHLAFTEKNVDWQIWLQRTGKYLPRKIVINYRDVPGSPEYAGVLSDWKFPASIAASVFRPAPPEDAKRIDIKQVKETKP
jgi:hypothetical protein